MRSSAGEDGTLRSLLQPLRLRGVEIPNRVMTSAMTLQYGSGHGMTARHAAFYRVRAEGGVGLLFSEQMSATSVSQSPFSNSLLAYDVDAVRGMELTTAALSEYPTKFFAQLFAGGAVAGSTVGIESWGPARGPSRIGVPGGETPLPLTVDEIQRIVEDFALSARNVLSAGADGVELHAAHGWLLGQFLSPFYNRRVDQYGGDVERRCRIVVELGEAVRRAIGEDVPLGVALSYDELIGEAGITESDTLQQLELLSETGLFDFFDLSVGSNHSEDSTISPMSQPEGYALDFARRARAAVNGRAAIFVAGRIVDPRMAAEAIGDGCADMVGMARAHLADPRLLEKSRRGEAPTRCVGANVCVQRALADQPIACVVNPATGREAVWGRRSAPTGLSQRILVVGAGPAGLRFAVSASAAGHRVTVFEKELLPGGHLRRLAALPTRSPWGNAIEDLVSQLQANGGELRLGHEIEPHSISDFTADEIVVATGASWRADGGSFSQPEGPPQSRDSGAKEMGLHAALDLTESDPEALGRLVLIVDESGMYEPIGLAERLGRAGVEVQVITPRTSLSPGTEGSLELAHAFRRLRGLPIDFTVACAIREIRQGSIVLEHPWGTSFAVRGVAAIVYATQRVPDDGLYMQLQALQPNVRVIGDALSPRETVAVIHEAEKLARSI